MSPEQKAVRLRDVQDELDRLVHLIDLAEMATCALTTGERQALSALLTEVSGRLGDTIISLRQAA